MAKITIFLPKKRIKDINKKRWKHNHHKKPFFLPSEINKAIREGIITKREARVFWKQCYKNRYTWKR